MLAQFAGGVQLSGSQPNYDHVLASRLVTLGMEVAAMTPDRLAQWLGQILGSRA